MRHYKKKKKGNDKRDIAQRVHGQRQIAIFYIYYFKKRKKRLVFRF